MDVYQTARALSVEILGDSRWTWPNGCHYVLENGISMRSGLGAQSHMRDQGHEVFLDVTDPGTAGHLMELLKEHDWLIADAISAAYEHGAPFGLCFAEQVVRLWGGDAEEA